MSSDTNARNKTYLEEKYKKKEKKKLFFFRKNEKRKMKNIKKKNQTMKKLTKMRKIMKIEEIWHTQNPQRFPGFTVVVVTFFVKIIDDFHDFVSECLFHQENQQLISGSHLFFRRKVILPTKINKKSLRSALLSIFFL